MKNLILKRKNPPFSDVDFSRAYSGVEMFSIDERPLRQIDCLGVDEDGRSVLCPLELDNDVVSSVWLS